MFLVGLGRLGLAGIPHQRLFQTGLKVIRNHPKLPGFGLFDFQLISRNLVHLAE
jgi:hypothetical protein